MSRIFYSKIWVILSHCMCMSQILRYFLQPTLYSSIPPPPPPLPMSSDYCVERLSGPKTDLKKSGSCRGTFAWVTRLRNIANFPHFKGSINYCVSDHNVRETKLTPLYSMNNNLSSLIFHQIMAIYNWF